MPRANKAEAPAAAPVPEAPAPAAKQLPKPWWSGGPLDTVDGMPWHVAVTKTPFGEIIELLPGIYKVGGYSLTVTRPRRFSGTMSEQAAINGLAILEGTTPPQTMKAPEASKAAPIAETCTVDPKQFMTTLELDRIEVTGWNPRKDFDQEELQGLADSIKAEGLHDPIIVRRKPGPEFGGRYQLVDGERRERAHRLLGYTTIRAIVEDMDDKRVRRLMLISTLQRADLKPMEIAEALQAMLAEDKDLTQEQLGKQLGKGQAWVSNHLRLLRAPDDLQKLLISGEITPRHAQVLLPFAGYPVYQEAMKALKREDGVTVDRLSLIVKGIIANDYSGERVLNFDDPGFRHKEYLPFMDQSGCKVCEDAKEIEFGKRKNRVCLNPGCFLAKLSKAKERKNQQAAQDKKDMMADTKKAVNLDLLSYDEFDRMKYAKFDTAAAGCPTCNSRRTTATGEEICTDPSCFRTKNIVEANAEKKVEEDKREQIIAAGKNYAAAKTGPLNARELRLILETLIEEGNLDEEALEPWTGVDPEIEDLNELVDFVPDEDLTKALLAAVLGYRCHWYSDRLDMIKVLAELGTPSTHKARKKPVVHEDREGEVTEGDEAEETPEPKRLVKGHVMGYACPDDMDHGDEDVYGTLRAAREAGGCSECSKGLAGECCGPEEIQVPEGGIAPDPIKVEPEPYPDSGPWHIAHDPLAGADLQEVNLP